MMTVTVLCFKVQIDACQHRLRLSVPHLRAGMCGKDRTVRTPPKSSVTRDPSTSTAQSTMECLQQVNDDEPDLWSFER